MIKAENMEAFIVNLIEASQVLRPSALAVYLQICILSDSGEEIKSYRQLAKKSKVSVNTVKKVYPSIYEWLEGGVHETV